MKKRHLQSWKQFGKAIPEGQEPEIRSREGAQLSLGVSGPVDSLCCGEECGWGRAVMGPRVRGSPG